MILYYHAFDIWFIFIWDIFLWYDSTPLSCNMFTHNAIFVTS